MTTPLTRSGRSLRALVSVGVLTALAAGALAQYDAPALNPFAPGGDDRQHASVELISDQTAITPGGVFLLGVTFDIEEGWHLYWDGKNDSGFPISVDLSLPEGFTREAIRWPAPVRKISPGDILDHIYTREVTLVIPVRAPMTIEPGASVTIRAEVEWLACEEYCIPESDHLTLELPVVAPSATRPPPSRYARMIKLAHARIPVPLTSKTPGVSAEWDGSTLVIRAQAGKEIAFYPKADCPDLIDPLGGAVARGDTLRLDFADDPEQDTIRGVIEIDVVNRRLPRLYKISLPRPG